jgi:hypothetical protein
MKLEPLVETISTKPRMIRKDIRPHLTEADKIAAAAKPGQTHVQAMVMFKYEGLNHTGCQVCEEPADVFFPTLQNYWQTNLAGMGVEWDPEIRL